MSAVYIVGVGMTRFGPDPASSVKTLTRSALLEAIGDCGLDASDIDTAFFSNAFQPIVEGQTSVPGQIALRHAGVEGIPIVNVENGCASASTAFWLAVDQIRSGASDVALAIGAEKMVFNDPARRAKVMAAFDGGLDVETAQETLADLDAEGAGITGPSGDGHRTKFMDIYAAKCRAHMANFGTTQRQLAIIASKNHGHASLNDRCHYKNPMTVDEVLAGRPLGYPLTVPMCAPLSDGGAAAIVCGERTLDRIGARSRAVRIDACVLKSATTRRWGDLDDHLVRRAARDAYSIAGIGPEEVQVAEVHDAAAFGELFMSEMLGICETGGGGHLAESGATALGGRIPINPSGGLESKGHPIGATGLGQIFELTTQLRGEAGRRQVEGTRVALQENGGGFVGVEEGATVVTVLSR
ncbi:thiolase family protein [Sphingobium xenophagum]|uniref:thiolase family protein n=1 Tax=Sphingobium xenophagum TaxID=121428 RepID=UPI0003A11831|nr:thiolase family protein [Sphingobium xenophagum]